MKPNQIELFAAIGRELDRQGFKTLNNRQVNACIEAANLVVREVGAETVVAGPGTGVGTWLRSDGTGLSSLTMAWHLSPGYRSMIDVKLQRTGPLAPKNYPLDPDDFNRCVGLLKAAPELRAYLADMGAVSPVWQALVENWQRLEDMLEAVIAADAKAAPSLYAEMQNIIGPIAHPDQKHHGWCVSCGHYRNRDADEKCHVKGCKCNAKHHSAHAGV
jgi:hypothetical protein